MVDGAQNRITVAGRDGEFRHFVSRSGSGPGELRRVRGLEVPRDGRLVVVDHGHEALLVFGAEGRFVEQVSLTGQRTEPVSSDDWSGAVVPTSVVRWPSFVGALPDTRLLALRSVERIVELHTLGGEVVPLYRAYNPPVDIKGEAATIRVGGLDIPVGSALMKFGPPLQVAALVGGRVAVIDTVGYRVKIIRDDGMVEAVLERPIMPIPVTAEMREVSRQRGYRVGQVNSSRILRGDELTGSLPRFSGSEVIVPEMAFASEVPVLNRVAVDSENRIWVERTGTDGLSAGPNDIFTEGGDYLGTLAADGVRIPNAFGPSGLMAYIELDELDVPTVRVLRLIGLEPVG